MFIRVHRPSALAVDPVQPTMTLRLAAFSVLALALVAAANPLVVREPLITVSVAKRVNSTGTANLVKRDRARVQALFNKNKIQPNTIVGSVPATDQAVDYTVDVFIIPRCLDLRLTSFHQVQIGSPPTTCKHYSVDVAAVRANFLGFTDTLLVDTGSSNTWVGSRSPYVQTETSVQTPDFVVRPDLHSALDLNFSPGMTACRLWLWVHGRHGVHRPHGHRKRPDDLRTIHRCCDRLRRL